jgi:hypothetical protein
MGGTGYTAYSSSCTKGGEMQPWIHTQVFLPQEGEKRHWIHTQHTALPVPKGAKCSPGYTHRSSFPKKERSGIGYTAYNSSFTKRERCSPGCITYSSSFTKMSSLVACTGISNV